MKLLWEEGAWEDYCSLQFENKGMLKRVNELIRDIKRQPFSGIGKPEPLKGNLSGWWSRRIDGANRIVYCYKDGVIIIAACKGHYED